MCRYCSAKSSHVKVTRGDGTTYNSHTAASVVVVVVVS
jgi:hypothetical protein